MVDLDELQRLADAVIPADGWEVLKLSNGADVRARHVTGASTWIAECRTDAEAAYIAAMHPDTAKKLIAVALKAKECRRAWDVFEATEVGDFNTQLMLTCQAADTALRAALEELK